MRPIGERRVVVGGLIAGILELTERSSGVLGRSGSKASDIDDNGFMLSSKRRRLIPAHEASYDTTRHPVCATLLLALLLQCPPPFGAFILQVSTT